MTRDLSGHKQPKLSYRKPSKTNKDQQSLHFDHIVGRKQTKANVNSYNSSFKRLLNSNKASSYSRSYRWHEHEVLKGCIDVGDVELVLGWVESKQVGHRLEIYAINSSDLHQELTLELDMQFVTANRALPTIDTLAPGERLKTVVLEPDHLKKWKYNTRYSNRPVETPSMSTQGTSRVAITEHKSSFETVEKSPKGLGFSAPLSADDEPIPREYLPSQETAKARVADTVTLVVYGQKGCPRCTHAKTMMDEKGISYRYVDIGVDKNAQSQMQKKMFADGFEGGSFTLPVIVNGDEVHYSIKDIDALVEEFLDSRF